MIPPKKALLSAQGYDTPLFPYDYLMKLDLNENVIGPSPKVLEALKGITREDIKFYPAYGSLIEKIAEYNNVEKETILPTNGADEAIKYVIDTFIESRDTILNICPTFSMPFVYARGTGCNYKEIKYQEKWVYPTENVIKNINEDTKLIIITTPNSPTGDIVPREELLKIINTAKHSLILIDETYISFTGESFADLPQKYDNVIVTRSMSKDFGLAGLRLGYIIANAKIINYIKRIASPFSVNNIAIKAGIAALDDIEYFESLKRQIKESGKILFEGLKLIAKKVYPGKGNFLLVDFGKKADIIYKRLLNSGIKVKYYKDTPDLENCFRITIPAPEQAKIFLKAVKDRDLIVFDMDGVLIDTRQSYRMATRDTYKHFSSLDISFEEIQQTKNLGGLNNDWDLTEYLLKNSGIDIPKNQIIDKFQELYFGIEGSGYISNESFLANADFFRNLARECDLAIFTGRPRMEAEFSLDKLGIKDLFLYIVTMDDVPDGFHKPDPYGINHILTRLSPVRTYYLGDTPDDMIAARKAGVQGIGVLPPQDKSDKLKEILLSEGAAAVINNVENLLDIITTGA